MKNKMHAWVMKPIKFMEKGEEGFIYASNCCLVYKGETLQTMKVFLYISKYASVLTFESNGFVHIKKVGDGIEGKDFFVEFPNNVHHPPLDVSEIKEEDYLFPVEVDFTICTRELLDEKKKNYTSFNFKDLMKLIWKIVDGPNYSANKDMVNEMIQALPTVLGNMIQEFDDEKLEELIDDWEETLIEYKEESQNKGERRKVSIEIYDFIIGILAQEQEHRAEIKANTALENLSDDDLHKKMKEAELDQDYELAAKIRDILKMRVDGVKVSN